MKTINKYIVEKLHINKDTVSVHKLEIDAVFNSMSELADALNSYFSEKLSKPIKVVKSEVVFRPDGPYSKSGRYVGEHFMVEFKNTPSKIRFGIREDTGIQMQVIYKNTFSNKVSYGDLYPDNFTTQCHLGKDNFLSWLTDSKNAKEFNSILGYFNLKDENN